MGRPSFWRVLMAYLIDMGLLCVICIVWSIGIINLFSLPDRLWLLAFIFSFVIVNVGYFMILEGREGRSVGKSIVNLSVKNVKNNFPIWRTCGAYGLDSILFMILAIFCLIVGVDIAPDVTRHFSSLQYGDGSGQLIVVFCSVFIGIPFLILTYYAFFETLFSGSLGKKLMSLRVVQQEEKRK